MKHCERCGYDWAPRTDFPVECPKCKSRYWWQTRDPNDKQWAKWQVRGEKDNENGQ